MLISAHQIENNKSDTNGLCLNPEQLNGGIMGLASSTINASAAGERMLAVDISGLDVNCKSKNGKGKNNNAKGNSSKNNNNSG